MGSSLRTSRLSYTQGAHSIYPLCMSTSFYPRTVQTPSLHHYFLPSIPGTPHCTNGMPRFLYPASRKTWKHGSCIAGAFRADFLDLLQSTMDSLHIAPKRVLCLARAHASVAPAAPEELLFPCTPAPSAFRHHSNVCMFAIGQSPIKTIFTTNRSIGGTLSLATMTSNDSQLR